MLRSLEFIHVAGIDETDVPKQLHLVHFCIHKSPRSLKPLTGQVNNIDYFVTRGMNISGGEWTGSSWRSCLMMLEVDQSNCDKVKLGITTSLKWYVVCSQYAAVICPRKVNEWLVTKSWPSIGRGLLQQDNTPFHTAFIFYLLHRTGLRNMTNNSGLQIPLVLTNRASAGKTSLTHRG